MTDRMGLLKSFCLACLAGLLLAGAAGAGVIDGSGVAADADVFIPRTISSPDPGNDNVGGFPAFSENSVIYDIEWTGPGAADVTFPVQDHDPAADESERTEYEFIAELTPAPGQPWQRVVLQLWLLTPQGLQRSTPGDGLGFDYDNEFFPGAPYTGASGFDRFTPAEDELIFADGLIEHPDNTLARFVIDVPNRHEVLSATGEDYSFVLRHAPLVPEPATMTLLGAGLVGLGRRRRCRRA